MGEEKVVKTRRGDRRYNKVVHSTLERSMGNRTWRQRILFRRRSHGQACNKQYNEDTGMSDGEVMYHLGCCAFCEGTGKGEPGHARSSEALELW